MTDKVAKMRVDREEIQITPEMIQAGIGELFSRYSEEVFQDPTETVRDIFKAMASLAPRSRP